MRMEFERKGHQKVSWSCSSCTDFFNPSHSFFWLLCNLSRLHGNLTRKSHIVPPPVGDLYSDSY